MAFYFHRRPTVAVKDKPSFPLLDLPMDAFRMVVDKMDRETFKSFAKSSLSVASLCSIPPTIQKMNMEKWGEMNTAAMSRSRLFHTDLAKYAEPYVLPFPGAFKDTKFLAIDLFALGWSTFLAASHSFSLVVLADSTDVRVSLIGRCRHLRPSPDQKTLEAQENRYGQTLYTSDILPEHNIVQVEIKIRPGVPVPKFSVFLSPDATPRPVRHIMQTQMCFYTCRK